MQSVSSRNWTRVAVSISYDDYHYSTGTSKSQVYQWGNIPSSFLFYLIRVILSSRNLSLFTSAWIQQDKFEYTLIVCSLTWDSVEFILSSFPLVISFPLYVGRRIHVLFQIRLRLIIISFLVDKFLLWEFVLPRSLNSFKGEVFFLFSQCSLHGMTWNLGFFHIQMMFLVFQRTKGNCFCVFILRRINSNCLVSVVWKFTTCWLFGCFFLSTNHGHRSASPLTHTWLIGSGVFPCLCQFVLIERVEEKNGPPTSIILLSTIFCWFLLAIIVGRQPASRTSFPHNLANVWGCHISLSHLLVWQSWIP